MNRPLSLNYYATYAENKLRNTFLLFVSIDIIGSTKYKSIDKWQKGIHTKLTQIKTEFEKLVINKGKDLKYEFSYMPWKIKGDEIIFLLHLDESDHLPYILDLILHCLDRLEAIELNLLNAEKDEVRTSYKEKQGPPLFTKGAAWIISLDSFRDKPIPQEKDLPTYINKHIIKENAPYHFFYLEKNPDNQEKNPQAGSTHLSKMQKMVDNKLSNPLRYSECKFDDFFEAYDIFSPLMDEGFRIAGHAKRKSLIISYGLLKEIYDKCPHEVDPIHERCYIHNFTELRGVWEEKPYPLIYWNAKGEDGKPINIVDTRLFANLSSVEMIEEYRKAQPWPELSKKNHEILNKIKPYKPKSAPILP